MHKPGCRPIASDIALEPHVGFRGTPDIVPSGGPSGTVENDPLRKSRIHNLLLCTRAAILSCGTVVSPRLEGHMRRREFITLIGGAAAWPLAAHAQQGEGVRRIGVLMGRSDPEEQLRLAAFEDGLQKLGWAEGHNIHIDTRFPTGIDQYQPLAKQLVAEHPEVIFAQSTPVTAALQRETRTIPIVFVAVSDPIGSSFVASLARPGSNITGLLYYEASIAGKWLAILKEIAPRLTRAALMANPKTTPYDYFLRGAEAAAPSLAIELLPSPVENAADIESVIEFCCPRPERRPGPAAGCHHHRQS